MGLKAQTPIVSKGSKVGHYTVLDITSHHVIMETPQGPAEWTREQVEHELDRLAAKRQRNKTRRGRK